MKRLEESRNRLPCPAMMSTIEQVELRVASLAVGDSGIRHPDRGDGYGLGYYCALDIAAFNTTGKLGQLLLCALNAL